MGVGLIALVLLRSKMEVGICGIGKWSTFEVIGINIIQLQL